MRPERLSSRDREVHDFYDALRTAEKEDHHGSMSRTLLAVAQLAAFQSRTERAIVSLVDDSYQYILAEASRDSSIVERTTHSTLKQQPRVSRGSASCDYCFLGEDKARHGHLPRDGLVVPDCSRDERFKNHALVKKDGGTRFYAAVPMISDAGHQVGVLAVFDSSPHEHSNALELENLRESAACAVRHLELIRTSVDCTRKSKLLDAITSSIDDQYPCLRVQEASKQDGDDGGAPGGSVASMQQKPCIPQTTESLSIGQLGTTQRQLQNAFHAARRALQQSLLVDDIAIYGPVGFDRLADAEDNHDSPSKFRAPDTTLDNPSILLTTSVHGEDTSEADPGPSPSVDILSALTSKYPSGTSFQFKKERVPKSFDGSENPQSTAGQELSTNDAAHRDLADEQMLDGLQIHGMSSHARSLIFLPVYHPHKRDLLGACFLWSTSDAITTPLSPNFTDLRAVSNCLSQNVAQILSQKMETGFLSNFSHELRSPIHGVMGAAQFLQDTTSSSYQTGLIDSILTCSNTLLGTLDLVLDHTKLGITAQEAISPGDIHSEVFNTAPSVTAMFATEPVDLALLIEEATESVVSGHFFENTTRTVDPSDAKEQIEDEDGQIQNIPNPSQNVKVILSLATNKNWSVETQPGAIRRIGMYPIWRILVPNRH